MVVVVLVSDDRGPRLIHGTLSALAALLVSATWLGINGNGMLVWSYLTDYGYGAASSEYGEKHALFSFQSWLTMVQIAERTIYLPHMVILVAGTAAGAVVRGEDSERGGVAGDAAAVVGDDAVVGFARRLTPASISVLG